MIIKCFLMGITSVLGSIIAGIIMLNLQGKISRKQTKETIKSWILILFLFSVMVLGLYFVNAVDWKQNSTMETIVNLRIPISTPNQVALSVYPLPAITSILLSLLIFTLITITKTVTAMLKVNPAQTDKRISDYFHFKELLYSAISVFLFKIIVYFRADGFAINGLVSSLGLLLALGALFYEIMRWVHYPGYHEGLKKELLCCHVTGMVILCFALSI